MRTRRVRIDRAADFSLDFANFWVFVVGQAFGFA
jgi:hypothetical protein